MINTGNHNGLYFSGQIKTAKWASRGAGGAGPTCQFDKNINPIHQDNSEPRSVEFLESDSISKSNELKKRRNGGRESGS